uniref:DUF707 domain-containing protein n=1 Tax=Araucaria cunninghamii TaxID=56994 RepID=A0A0D6QY43_ARACU
MDLKNWWQKMVGNFSCRHLFDGSQLCEGTRRKVYGNKAIFMVVLMLLALFVGSVLISENYAEKASSWGVSYSLHVPMLKGCKEYDERHRPQGSEQLPIGIVQATSNLEMRPLWGVSKVKSKVKSPQNLLAIAVGIKQKENVNKIVQKFPSDNFTVMLFHYDGVVDKWSDLSWSARAIHVVAINQTKWWFAKRFLHPDIVAEYNYIFLWDEDLGVENFHAGRYLAIMEDEGLEISQPGLDFNKSEVHHRITVRSRRSRVHRRIYKLRGSGRCYENSTGPPCTGWVEMMAPVFSKPAWRCAWYMIQNDLVHAWGVDMKLGYCAQGDRSKKVGVIDSEYIVHQGIPSLGGVDDKSKLATHDVDGFHLKSSNLAPESAFSERAEVRRQSYSELDIFTRRWAKAVRQDKCWVDPYLQPGSKPVSKLKSEGNRTVEKRKNASHI